MTTDTLFCSWDDFKVFVNEINKDPIEVLTIGSIVGVGCLSVGYWMTAKENDMFLLPAMFITIVTVCFSALQITVTYSDNFYVITKNKDKIRFLFYSIFNKRYLRPDVFW